MSSTTTTKKKIKISDWNPLLIEKSVFPSFPGAAAHSIVLSASLLPDYARPQHTEAPQSMPHAAATVYTPPRLARVTLPRPVNISCVPPS